MSCCIDDVVGMVLQKIFDCLSESIGREIDYFLKYKENIEILEEKVNDLKDERETVKAAVDIAKANGKTIKKVAEKWLEEVQLSLKPMEEELQNKENVKCHDVCSRRRLGKKRKDMVDRAIKLKQNRNEFGDEVARPTLLKDIWYTSRTSYEQFSTRTSIFEEIMEALRDDKKSKIGIYGMAGVGKTTMVEEVGKQAGKGPFDEVAMAVFSQNPDLKKIQEKLADCLNLKLEKNSEEGRAGELCNRLKNGKKILVILDDVWDDQTTLKKIGIPTDTDNNMGCKILLTSRRLDVCKKMGFENNFQIGLLSVDEAWHLFKRTVGDFIEADPQIHSVAQQVCRECDHLPLAICAVGGALTNEKDKHVWNDALKQLKHYQGYKIDGVEEKVYSCIEWSYEYLKHVDVRSCFLHCSLFPEDIEIPINLLVPLGVGTKFLESTDRTSMERARDRTLVIVGILKKSNLLLEGKKDNMVKMHDVVRDVAISIASKDQNAFLVRHNVNVWPDKDDYKCCKSISLSASDNVRRLPDKLECRELCTLLLASNGDSPLQLPNSFFERMEKLEVLILRGMKLEPSSVSNLVSLRMLLLYGCDLVNLSFLKEMKNLEILMVYNLKEVVLEIEQLTCLQSLFVGDFDEGTRIPSGSLSSLSNLEELYILEEYNGWEVEGNASIVEINCLTSLTALHIYIPKDVFLLLPKDLPRFQSLTKYKIWIGSDDYYSLLDKHTETKVLGLDVIPLMDGLDVLIAKAEVLYLFDLDDSKKVLHDRDGEWFSDLKLLKVRRCEDVEHLLGKPKWSSKTHGPSPLGSFGKLRQLEIDSCRSMKYLFSASTARCLPELHELYVGDCEALEEIISGDEEVTDKVIFHQLKDLTLRNLPILRSIYANTKKISTTECSTSSTVTQPLFNEKVMFPVLEKLVIDRLNTIKAIWDKQVLPVLKAGDSFQCLQELTAIHCISMKYLFSSSTAKLQELEIEECEALEEIIGGDEEVTVIFHQLKKLELGGLPNFKSIWQSSTTECSMPLFNEKVMFPVLEKLIIRKLDSIKGKWDELLLVLKAGDSFQYVQELNEVYCKGTEHLLGKPKWSSKTHGPSPLGSFGKLRELTVAGYRSMKYLFSASTARCLPKLHELFVGDCESLEEIIGGDEEVMDKVIFHQLKKLRLTRLPNLISIYANTKKTSTTESSTPSTVTLPLFNEKVMFPVLEKLVIDRLNTIKAIWDKQVLPVLKAGDSFQCLQELTAIHCISMKYLFSSSTAKLHELEIEECEALEEIIGGDEEVTVIFHQLKILELGGLPNFRSIWQSSTTECSLPLFNDKVMFLVLEKLFIYKLDSIKAIWDKQLISMLKGGDSFQHLQKLVAHSCKKMEEILAFEVGQGEEEAEANDEIPVFPHLETIHLWDLSNLKSSEEETKESQLQALVNHKVRFPSLKNLSIVWSVEDSAEESEESAEEGEESEEGVSEEEGEESEEGVSERSVAVN